MASKAFTEREVFTKNYSSFCNILKHEDGLFPKLVNEHIISFDDMDEVKSQPVGERGRKHISGPLTAGHTHGFYGLLEIMQTDGKPDTQRFARKIKKECDYNSNNEVEADFEDEKLVKDKNQPNGNAVKKEKEEPLYDDAALKKKYDEQKADTQMRLFDKLNSQEKNIVANVQVIIVVVNNIELKASLCYLAPPDRLNAVLRLQCKSPVGPDTDPRIFYVGKFGKCPVAVTQVQQGRGKDAVYHARKEFFKNLVLIAAVGIAAGFPENNVKLGDVLISDQIQDCSIFKRKDEDLPRGNKLSASKLMRQLLKHDLDWNFLCTKDGKRDASIIFGPILSKPMLLDNKDERERLLRDYNKEAKGFEMEGFGIMDSSLDFIVIKGVCDLGHEKNDLWQPTAALAANNYLYHHFCQTDLSLLIERRQSVIGKFLKDNFLVLVVFVIFLCAAYCMYMLMHQ